MTPEEIKFLVGLLPGFGVGVLVAAAVAYLLVKHFASGYLGQKGKNLADKEDIADLTSQVEEIKRQQAEMIEAVKARNQLRMAAVDRRLQAHQEAFALLRVLMQQAHGPELGKQVMACQEWWEKNCLYLEPQAREAFSNAYFAANVHQTLLQASQFQMNASPEQAKQGIENITTNWARVTGALNVVLESVALPPLTLKEADPIKPSAAT
ncbi:MULTISPECIES: hypothetical protein [Variovorax]|uniref:hypothetical protein n=1 Tax=Variovorax TaxID=34072 RepID=UPI002863C3A2|nr:hypothetical protein [Variovorax sp. 3319]MDR6887865.1 hypothetical protein [Variovorax sp. 3319]